MGCAPLSPATRCVKNHALLSIAWFLLFTAFASVQNLEASVVSGVCGSCDVTCEVAEGNSTDSVCSVPPSGELTDGKQCVAYVRDVGYCSPALRACGDSACRDTTLYTEGGAVVLVSKLCKSDSNVGSFAFCVLYLVFTCSCLCGPYIVHKIGATRGISIGFLCFTLICVANVVVATDPANVALQYGMLLPAAAVVGLAASFMWCAQGAYLTDNAECYATLKSADNNHEYLGRFNGTFFACWRLAQIFGNLLASYLLQTVGVSYATLFLVYLGFSCLASVLAFQITPVPCEPDTAHKVESPLESLKGMCALACTASMGSLIPLMVYSGLYQGFIFVDFTTNWVAKTVGVSGIGFVMAAFGGASVVSSVALGKLSDATGYREAVMAVAIIAHGSFFLLLRTAEPGGCSGEYHTLILAASLWGVGDAALNTQVGALLGSSFPTHRTHAFSHLKLWQSVATATSFFLNYNPNLLTREQSLTMTFGCMLAAFAVHYVFVVVKQLRAVQPEAEDQQEMMVRTTDVELELASDLEPPEVPTDVVPRESTPFPDEYQPMGAAE